MGFLLRIWRKICGEQREDSSSGQEELQQLKAELNDVRSENEMAKKKIKNLEKKNEKLEEEINSLKKDYKDLKDEKKDLDSKLSSSQATYGKLQEDKKKEAEANKKQLEQLEAAKSSLEGEKKGLESKLANAENALAQQKDELAKVEKVRAAEKAELERTAKEQKAKLESLAKKHKAELESLTEKHKVKLESLAKEHETALERLTKERDSFATEAQEKGERLAKWSEQEKIYEAVLKALNACPTLEPFLQDKGLCGSGLEKIILLWTTIGKSHKFVEEIYKYMLALKKQQTPKEPLTKAELDVYVSLNECYRKTCGIEFDLFVLPGKQPMSENFTKVPFDKKEMEHLPDKQITNLKYAVEVYVPMLISLETGGMSYKAQVRASN